MRIYLMRHADAVEPGTWGGSDRDRPLSPLGEARLLTAIGEMHRLKISADLLLTSPYRRARQTADHLSEHLHILQTQECPELAAGARLAAFLKILAQNEKIETLWIVSHMPEIAMFASQVTGIPALLEQGFRPGQVLAAEDGKLLWNRRVEDWPGVSA